MLSTIIRQIGQYKTATLLTPLFSMLEVAMDVLIPYVIASLIDKGINAGSIDHIYMYGAIMLGMAFFSLCFGIMAGRCSAFASAGFASNLRSAMYRNIQTFSFADIDKFSAPGLVTRMTTDVSNLQNAFQMLLRIAVFAPFRLVLSIIMCMIIDPRMSMIFLVAMVVLSIFIVYIISHVSKLFTQAFKQYDKLNASVQENVSGIRVVKTYVREEYETKKFNAAAEGLYKLFVKAETLMASTPPAMNLVVYACIIALSWFGAQFIVGGTLTTGQLTSLFTYVISILISLLMLSMIFVMLTMSAANAKRVAEVIELKTSISNPPQPVMQVQNGNIRFEHVNFTYNKGSEEYALTDINLEIHAGETIGIVGGTGSGKSTMVSLISRLYDTTEGQVFVGGKDVRTYDLDTLHHAVSVVLQKNMLFSGSILDNLRWGNEQATEEQCREACRLACADEFIDQMPEGYNSHIEQGGNNVSGGQKQRLCIARALLRQPKILILDDSTSACDTTTDAKIQMAFRNELPDMTKLIIAQRISSVEACDRIIVMDKGRITGFDTHQHLLESNQLYQEIYHIQHEEGGDFDMTKGGTL